MVQCTREAEQLTIGVDLGDKNSEVRVLEGRQVTERATLKMTKKGIRSFFADREPCRVVIEAGGQSAWVSRVIESCGHDVVIANPRKVGLISKNYRKTDGNDAELLARMGRADPELLSPIEHRGPQAQADLALLRSRDALVKARTQLVNHVRGAAKSWGIRLQSCSTEAFHRRVPKQLPEEIKSAVEPLLATIGDLTGQIRAYARRVEEVSKERYPETGALRQVAGIGPLTALAFVLTIEDPGRFRNRRQVASFVGLVPKQQQSGKEDPQLRITKAGNEFLRRLLVGSAHYILGPFGPDTDLRRWGFKLCARGGKNAKKRAVVAVARKLTILLHRLWQTGEAYEPLRNSELAAEGDADE